MNTPLLVIVLIAVGICLVWFGYKILKTAVKVAAVVVVIAVLGFLAYQMLK